MLERIGELYQNRYEAKKKTFHEFLLKRVRIFNKNSKKTYFSNYFSIT